MVNMAIFVSGGGTNCENIIKYFEGSEVARPAVVISNKASAGAVAKAERLGVPVEVVPKAALNNPDIILPLLERYSVDFIVLAGFLLVIPGFLIDGDTVMTGPALEMGFDEEIFYNAGATLSIFSFAQIKGSGWQTGTEALFRLFWERFLSSSAQSNSLSMWLS